MDKHLVEKLEKLVAGMDLPFYRKTIKSYDGLRWLDKNMEDRNAAHKNYLAAKELIKELLHAK